MGEEMFLKCLFYYMNSKLHLLKLTLSILLLENSVSLKALHYSHLIQPYSTTNNGFSNCCFMFLLHFHVPDYSLV